MGRSCAEGRELEPPDPHGSVPFPGPPATKKHLRGGSPSYGNHTAAAPARRGEAARWIATLFFLTLLIPKMLLQFGSGTKPLRTRRRELLRSPRDDRGATRHPRPC